MNPEEKDSILKLCKEYSNLFYLEGDSLSYTNAIRHSIITKNQDPIYVKQYKTPFLLKEEYNNHITKLIKNNIIQPSRSGYSAPSFLIPKKSKDGIKKYRLVIDYRKLNEVTEDDSYPLPNINEILNSLGKAKYFTTLDLASGYHQILIDPQDRHKTAFNTPYGHYEFLRLSFGLKVFKDLLIQ